MWWNRFFPRQNINRTLSLNLVHLKIHSLIVLLLVSFFLFAGLGFLLFLAVPIAFLGFTFAALAPALAFAAFVAAALAAVSLASALALASTVASASWSILWLLAVLVLLLTVSARTWWSWIRARFWGVGSSSNEIKIEIGLILGGFAKKLNYLRPLDSRHSFALRKSWSNKKLKEKYQWPLLPQLKHLSPGWGPLTPRLLLVFLPFLLAPAISTINLWPSRFLPSILSTASSASR